MQTNRNSLISWLLSAAFTFLLVLPLSAQKSGDKLDKQPAYPGGMPALIEFMITNIKYPEAAKTEQAEGMVLVKFIVGKDGSISGIKTLTKGSQNPREDFVLESLRVIKAMPKWIPGESNGKKVKAEMALPIKFALDGKKP